MEVVTISEISGGSSQSTAHPVHPLLLSQTSSTRTIPGFTIAGSTSGSPGAAAWANNTRGHLLCVNPDTRTGCSYHTNTWFRYSFQSELCSEVLHMKLRLEEQRFWPDPCGAALEAGLCRREAAASRHRSRSRSSLGRCQARQRLQSTRQGCTSLRPSTGAGGSHRIIKARRDP